MGSAIVTVQLQDFILSDTGLQVADNVTFDAWLEYGKTLGHAYSRIQWALGDWINAGERLFGEMYSQALDETDYSYGTLRNYASICARIPHSIRNPKLLFHQTKYIAQLDTDPAAQKKIVEFAVAHELSGDKVKEIVDKTLGKQGKRERHYILKGHEYISNDDGVIHVDLGRNAGKVYVDVYQEA